MRCIDLDIGAGHVPRKHNRNITALFDNRIVQLNNWSRSDDSLLLDDNVTPAMGPNIIQFSLTDNEMGNLSMAYEFNELIDFISSNRMSKLTRKKRKLITTRFVRQSEFSFKQINILKRRKFINLIENPEQEIRINNTKCLILSVQYQCSIDEIIGWKFKCKIKNNH